MTRSLPTARPDVKHFADKTEATERTLRALGNLGFTIARDTDTIAGTFVSTFHHTPGNQYHPRERKPEIAAAYVDSDTGNKVVLGMDIAPSGNLRWPYDWTGRTVKPGVAGAEPLAEGGNHDNNQGELVRQLTNLLAAAHFNKPIGYVGAHTPGYSEWEADIIAKLDPIDTDSQPPRQ